MKTDGADHLLLVAFNIAMKQPQKVSSVAVEAFDATVQAITKSKRWIMSRRLSVLAEHRKTQVERTCRGDCVVIFSVVSLCKPTKMYDATSTKLAMVVLCFFEPQCVELRAAL